MGLFFPKSSRLLDRELGIWQDEPCYYLEELNLDSPNGTGLRRYELLTVVRNDGLAQYKREMGSANAFNVNQFRVRGGLTDPSTGNIEIYNTVAELREIADMHRDETVTTELHPESDLWTKWFNQLEEAEKRMKHQSVFGPAIIIQR